MTKHKRVSGSTSRRSLNQSKPTAKAPSTKLTIKCERSRKETTSGKGKKSNFSLTFEFSPQAQAAPSRLELSNKEKSLRFWLGVLKLVFAAFIRWVFKLIIRHVAQGS
jgi:hypothetical protein